MHVDVFRFFHAMYMHGPSSKQVYCRAMVQFIGTKAKTLSPLPTKDIYKHFLWMYGSWVDIDAILRTKLLSLLTKFGSMPCLMDSQMMEDVGSLGGESFEQETITSDSIALNWRQKQQAFNSLKNAMPLEALCSACFGSGRPATFAVVCLDGNFQQRCLGRGVYNNEDEERDCRLFVGTGQNADYADSEEVLQTRDLKVTDLKRKQMKFGHAHPVSKLPPIRRYQKMYWTTVWLQRFAAMTFL